MDVQIRLYYTQYIYIYIYAHSWSQILSYTCAYILNSEIVVHITVMLKPSNRRSSSRLCIRTQYKLIELLYMHTWLICLETQFCVVNFYLVCVLVCWWYGRLLCKLLHESDVYVSVWWMVFVYSMLVFDFLCRVETCVVYMRVSNACF